MFTHTMFLYVEQGLKLMASYSSVTTANPISKKNGWNN